MSIEFAIQNLAKTLKTDYQKKYLNEIINFINANQKANLNKNPLFAKLYIYNLNQMLEKYDATIFDEIPQKELHKILNTPIELFYQAFKTSFDQKNREAIFKKNGLDLKFETTAEDREFNKIKLDNMSKDDILKLITEVYDLETVKNKLEEMITKAITNFA